jgi:hypothetical protein
MHPSEVGAFLAGIGDWLSQTIATGSGPALQLKSWIVERFGANGLIAATIVTGVFVFFLIVQFVRLLISTVKYLVVPAIVLAFIATLLLPVSFYSALPVTATICSVFLLFKG